MNTDQSAIPTSVARLSCRARNPAIFRIAKWGLLVAACQGPAPKGDPALTCQLTACTCVSLDRPFFRRSKTTEISAVLWRQNGAAYCPEGFELQPPKEKFRIKTYTSSSSPRPAPGNG